MEAAVLQNHLPGSGGHLQADKQAAGGQDVVGVGVRRNDCAARPVLACRAAVLLQGLLPPTASLLGPCPGACLRGHLDGRVAGQAKPVLHHLALQAGRQEGQAGRQAGRQAGSRACVTPQASRSGSAMRAHKPAKYG